MVRAPDSWLKGRRFESLLGRRENFLLQGRLSVLTLISVSVPPRVTAVAACKRSRSFCQKCRWQVTAKHAYTLRMWLCLKWHGAWLYGAHRTCAEIVAAVSCGTSHASAVSTPLRWIFKKRAVKLVTHVEPHAIAVSLLKRAENSATEAIINQSQTSDCWGLDGSVQSTLRALLSGTFLRRSGCRKPVPLGVWGQYWV